MSKVLLFFDYFTCSSGNMIINNLKSGWQVKEKDDYLNTR